MAQKIEMDIELLLRWAYLDELSKRQTSAAEGIWDKIQDYTNHGGIDSGHGAAQRYAHFGLPDPDAERIERAVSSLGETVIDWERQFDVIAGDLAGLVSINDLRPQEQNDRQPASGWGVAGKRALKAFFGISGAAPMRDRPRDVLIMGGIKTDALLTMHAIKATRPEWHDEDPRPKMIPALRGKLAMVVGECKGKNLYTTGSYCPLTWSPSPLSIILARADYFAWHQGLMRLAVELSLERFVALPPKALRAPWFGANEIVPMSRVIPVIPTGRNRVSDWGTLPLKPERSRADSRWKKRPDQNKDLHSGANP